VKRRYGAAVLTEWALVFTLVLAPMIVIGGSLYGWMTSSSLLSKALEAAGEHFTTTGSWDETLLTTEATRLGVPLVTGRDTLLISITAADSVTCPAPTAAEGWGAAPTVCSGDTVTITLRRVVGDGGTPPLGIGLPTTEEVTWSGVAQRTSGASLLTASGGSLSGQVTDSSGAALAGATVILEGIATVTSGVDGAYYIGGISSGGATSTLRVQASGYLESATTVVVPTAGDIRTDFALIAGLVVRVHLVPASEPIRVSNGTFSTTTGWTNVASGAFLAPASSGATLSSVSSRLQIVTGSTASQGAQTTLAGSYKAGSTYLLSLEYEGGGSPSQPVAFLFGNEVALDYAAESRTTVAGIEQITMSWTPQITYSSGVILAIRANNDLPTSQTLYVDNVVVVRESVGVTGATVTATNESGSTRKATDVGSGWYSFILQAGSYRIVANASGSTTTDPGDPLVICLAVAAGCEAYTGPSSYSFDLAID
jgi:hypothetical protein